LPDNTGTTTCSPRSLTFPELISVKVYATDVPACAQKVGEHKSWIVTGCTSHYVVVRVLVARKACTAEHS
jgi:hypothetical protein